MRLYLYCLCLAILNACVSHPLSDLPTLSPQQALWFQVEQLDQDGYTLQTSLLSVQGEREGVSRWVMSDAFGAPQARLLAKTDGWHTDGFAPPNASAKQLFTALLPLIKQGFRQPETLRTSPQHLWRITPIDHSEGV